MKINLENTGQYICLSTKVHQWIYIFSSVEKPDGYLEKMLNVLKRILTSNRLFDLFPAHISQLHYHTEKVTQ